MSGTSTPWYSNKKEHITGHTSYQIFHKIDDYSVNYVCGEISSKEDAEFIIKACNAHDDLVSALETMLEAYSEDVGEFDSKKYNAVHQAAVAIDKLNHPDKYKAKS